MSISKSTYLKVSSQEEYWAYVIVVWSMNIWHTIEGTAKFSPGELVGRTTMSKGLRCEAGRRQGSAAHISQRARTVWLWTCPRPLASPPRSSAWRRTAPRTWTWMFLSRGSFPHRLPACTWSFAASQCGLPCLPGPIATEDTGIWINIVTRIYRKQQLT